MKRYDSYIPSGVSWIGEIPSHWEILRAKNMFYRVQRPVRSEDETITCFRDGLVTLRKNRRTEGFTEALQESGYQGIRKGDLVIHQMDAFAGSVGVSDSDGKGTPVYICCLPKKNKYFNFYYAHALREMARTGFIKSLYRGIRERSSDFRYETFAVQRLPIPPLHEQEAIVAFLDEKIGKIDSYISEREKELMVLEELKQAEIASVVTRGLNPDASMRDSSIPWLGKIPAHWKELKLSQVAKEHFLSNKYVHHQNLLSLSYGKIIRKDINRTEGLLPTSFDGYQIVEPGNIVLRLTDLQNDQKSLRVGLVTEEGIVTGAYLSLEVRDNVIPEYAYLFLHTSDIHKFFYTMGSGVRQGLNFAGIRDIKVTVPPLSEQQRIVDHIKAKTTKIEGLIADLKVEIDRLKEYKQRLISDVVTGQIDVRDYKVATYAQ